MAIFIRDKEQAEAIIESYESCDICSECPLNNPEGLRCSYLYELAEKYLKEEESK